MKKRLLLLAALLQCFLAFSQEAESDGSSTAGLTVIPYLELIPNFGDGTAGFGFGNSSLYTLFEGSASKHFSWTLVNNWFTAWDEDNPFGWQYRNLGRSDESNFLLYCKADLTFGGWNITLGKDCMSIGGFEYDDWDWDIQANFATPLWTEIVCYQWGGKVAWTTPSQKTTLSLQMVSSPFGEHPFSSGLWAYSGQWRGQYGWFSNIWSASAIAYEKGKYDWLFCLGQRATFGNWAITLDYNNSVGPGDDPSSKNDAIQNGGKGEGTYHLIKGTTLNGTVAYDPQTWFNISAKGMWTTAGWSAGILAGFYPLKGSRDLKIHAGASVNNMTGKTMAVLNAGVRYNLGIHLW